ncbi:PEP-CTERM sorting domain-containing protein [Massilia sp. CCM 9210]|uniref:PEP-CTERM sorting domain-containing protein n=1 Tax=Massilia scottii TaxID=3057166 RepID=UPI002796AA76|nr:PEP-CTERM sorting domain-containing protein [Massilia sp. CCM 9210]MDQ1813038.1 PEP-CTERM sorting domain-containing protein [Massilia sp. CCM 9210]
MAKLKQQTGTLAVAALLAAAGPGSAIAGPVVYDFDRFADGTVLSSQYAGLSFSQATVLLAGASLNELAFPPRSLAGALFDDGGPVTITFLAPVFSVGGYFTYLSGLTVSAYGIHGALLDTGSAAYAINLADGSGDPGSSPNEFLQVANAAGLISYVTFTSHAGGASFVVDDLTVEAGVAIPAPSTIALTFAGLCAGLLLRCRSRRS